MNKLLTLLSAATRAALDDPALEARVRADLTAARVRASGPVVRGLVAEAEDHEAHGLVTDSVANGGARSRARAVAANPLARFLLLSGAFAVLSVIVLVIGSR